MTGPSKTQAVLFPELFRRKLLAFFDQAHASSDGGAVLVKAADARLRLTERLAGCLRDLRQSRKVAHRLVDLVRQRVFGLACGYEDCNDAARLSDDPIHKLVLDRDPVDGAALGSVSTLCRFENSVSNRELLHTAETLAETVVERHRVRLRGKAKEITIDLDAMEDPTHGNQQLSFFNGHYNSWCYLPLVGFLRFDAEPELYAFAAVLRPGNAPATRGAISVLRRSFAMLRKAFPKARLVVRLDGGFCSPEVFELLEKSRVHYIVGYGDNAVLKRLSAPFRERAKAVFEATGETAAVYGDCQYQARTWKRERRVIIKSEIIQHVGREPRANTRYVVTNLDGSPEELYVAVYCGRGEVENRIKELGRMGIGRTSCTSFKANQLRVLLTLAAYVLMQEVRLAASGTSLARAQIWTLRERLLKIGARVVVSVRRLVLHLPRHSPFATEWCAVAVALGAQAER